MVRTDSLQEFKPVPAGHIVIRDNVVGRLVVDFLQSLVGAGCRLDREPVVLAFEKGLGQVGDIRFIVNMKNMDLLSRSDGRHRHTSRLRPTRPRPGATVDRRPARRPLAGSRRHRKTAARVLAGVTGPGLSPSAAGHSWPTIRSSPAQYSLRISYFWTLPVAVSGRSSQNSTLVGAL